MVVYYGDDIRHHTTCGQCHISRPTYHDGGLMNGHEAKEIASMRDTCIACHGARVANEYQGKNEGVEGSVHWLQQAMPCYECHDVKLRDIADERLSPKVILHQNCWKCHEVETGVEASESCEQCHTGMQDDI